jgi:two-component system chemotaxis response regulator CheY
MDEVSALRVLVVDDSLVIRRLIKLYLGRLGIETVVEASNCRAGLQKLEEERFDLIFSDWSMPGKSGLALLKAVRADAKHRRIPFVMLTAEGLKGSIASALEAGVSRYVLKPFDFETIKREVEIILGRG